MPRSRSLPAVLLLVTAAPLACSSHQPVVGNSSPVEAGTTSLGAALSVSITVPAVPAGEEGTKCVRVRLGNDAPVRIGKIHNTLSESSHHFVVSSVEDTSVTDTPLFDCPPFRAALTGAPLTITQKHDDTVLMPEGVAYTVGENQLMHLELHYINSSTQAEDITASAEIFPIADPAAELVEASFLLVGNLDITIPPKSKHSLGPVYQPLPDTFADVNFYALTGHTHRFGTNVQVGVAASETAPVTSLYAPAHFQWDEPELTRLEPTRKVPAGGGFSYQCDWDNPTDATVKFGESALTEMCFFWAYYYPKQDGSRLLLQGVDKAYGGDAGASLDGPPCAAVGDTGNSLGVGKYCTKAGAECGGTAPVCLADYTRGVFGNFCTKTCSTDADCGAGASCLGTSTAVCMPTSCVATLDAGGPADAAAP